MYVRVHLLAEGGGSNDICVGELFGDWLISVRGASLHAIPYGNVAGSSHTEQPRGALRVLNNWLHSTYFRTYVYYYVISTRYD